jgi:hypothetical protein
MQQAILNYIIIGLTLSTIGLIYKYSDNQANINKNEIKEEKDDYLRDKIIATENIQNDGITKIVEDMKDESLSKLEKCKLDEPKVNRRASLNEEEIEGEKYKTTKKSSVKSTTATIKTTTTKKTTKKVKLNYFYVISNKNLIIYKSQK